VEGFEPSISRATTWRLNHWATPTTGSINIIAKKLVFLQSVRVPKSLHLA
jgi:hypothetical protein